MKFFHCLAFLSVASAVASTCEYEPELVNSPSQDFEDGPLKIVSQDTSTVTFTVSQTWSDEVLCMVATYYTSETGTECPSVGNAAPGEIAEYTAVCVGGYANVDLWVYEPTFADNMSPVVKPDICVETEAIKTYLYQYSVPCSAGDENTCPPPEVTCASLPDMDYDFETATDIDDWTFGKTADENGNTMMLLDADTLEVETVFSVPTSDITGVTIELDLYKILDMSTDQEFYLRVGDYYFHLTSSVSGVGGTTYFGGSKVVTSKIGSGFSSNYKVVVTVPATFYAGGSIPFGVRTTGSKATFKVGIDNVKVDVACSDFTGGNKAGGGGGDPHFQLWDREHASFHGECDLVMVHSDTFHNNAGLDLHVRTTIQDYFSYIEMAALRIGEMTLEFHQTHFYLDGEKHEIADLPMTFGEGEYTYTVTNAPVEAGKNPAFYQYYKVDLGDHSSILFRYYKQYLTISVDGHASDFGDSVGLLGDYATGNMLSREGSLMHDFDQYGFEWQVNPEDAKLFLDARAPQLPFEQCRMPTAARPARRKLRGGDAALFETAKQACAHVRGNDFELCTDDIMSTGDVGLASLW